MTPHPALRATFPQGGRQMGIPKGRAPLAGFQGRRLGASFRKKPSGYRQSGIATLSKFSLAATFRWLRHRAAVCSGKVGISSKFLRKSPHMSLIFDLQSEAP